MRHHRDHPPHDRPGDRRRASDRTARVATMIRLVRRAGKDPDVIRTALHLAEWSEAGDEVIEKLTAKAEATIAERHRAAGVRQRAEMHVRRAGRLLELLPGDLEAERTARRLFREASRLRSDRLEGMA